MSQRILITGGTGFIGRALCKELLARGHSLTVYSRQKPEAVTAVCGAVEATADLNLLKAHVGFDVVFNLAGEGIADKRWSDARKQALLDSRVAVTQTLVNVIRTWRNLPGVLISGSAVGYYGDQGERLVTEDTPPHPEFTHKLCADWEQATLSLEADAVRTCLSRTGVVVGKGGGFLQRMVLPFKLGLGGRLGSGRQYMPWVHRDDVVACLIWMMESEQAEGPYNVVSPAPRDKCRVHPHLGRSVAPTRLVPGARTRVKGGARRNGRLAPDGPECGACKASGRRIHISLSKPEARIRGERVTLTFFLKSVDTTPGLT